MAIILGTKKTKKKKQKKKKKRKYNCWQRATCII